MPCVAKHLLSWVLSTTPGNFLAEKTVKGSLKQEASTGARPVLMPCVMVPGGADEDPVVCDADVVAPTFTNENRSRNSPSVRTERSWSTNQMPMKSFWSVSWWRDGVSYLSSCFPGYGWRKGGG